MAAQVSALGQERPVSLWALAWRQFRKNAMSVVGLILLLAFSLAALAAPWISPYSPVKVNLSDETRLRPPSALHWFGTDNFGRDVFARTIYGARISLAVAFVATMVSIGIGMVVGSVAGFYGGIVDNLSMRLVDLLLALPIFFVIIILQSLLAHPNILYVMGLVGATSWMGTARILRGQILKEREMGYVLAAYGIGASRTRIIFRHILPNVLGLVVVAATLLIGRAIMIEAGLSFLGFGTQPPNPSWGAMLAQGQAHLNTAPWMALFPGLFLSLTVVAFNFIGDGLVSATNPHERR